MWQVAGGHGYIDHKLAIKDMIRCYDKLQERLISIGKFYAEEAVLMIEHMEKIGKIEKTEDYNVYRIIKSVTTKEEGWGNMR